MPSHKLGSGVRPAGDAYQASVTKLRKELKADDFLELDWFLYLVNQGVIRIERCKWALSRLRVPANRLPVLGNESWEREPAFGNGAAPRASLLLDAIPWVT